MRGNLVASDVRLSGGGGQDSLWAVDDTMREGSGQSERIKRRMTRSKEGVDDPMRRPTTQQERGRLDNARCNDLPFMLD